MQQTGMDSNLRRNDRRSFDFTATMVAKAPVLFLAVLSGGLVARTALPAVADALSSGTTSLWSAPRPLYPFFFVNLIIFVIWRLSDWEQHGPAEEKPPEARVLVKVKSSDANPIEPLARKPSRETWKEISASSPIAPAVPAVVPVTVPALRHVELPPASEKSVVCWEFGTKISVSESRAKVAVEEVPVPPALKDAREGEVEEDDDDDEENLPMEVMWKAIVEKRMRETATTSRLVTPPRGQRLHEAVGARPLPVLGGREPSSVTSRDKSDRLYNDFIMNRHNKMRL